MQTLIKAEPIAALGIDPGCMKPIFTCVSTSGESFTVGSSKLKNAVHILNKKAVKQSARLADPVQPLHIPNIMGKRDRAILLRDRLIAEGVKQSAWKILSYCLEHKIDLVACGTGPFGSVHKQWASEWGRSFFNPFTISYLASCELSALCGKHGIEFIEAGELFTSKASFLDGDTTPLGDDLSEENTKGLQISGKRSRTGRTYTTAQNLIVNADCNAAANILKRASLKFGIEMDLSRIDVNTLTYPDKYTMPIDDAMTVNTVRCQVELCESAA